MRVGRERVKKLELKNVPLCPVAGPQLPPPFIASISTVEGNSLSCSPSFSSQSQFCNSKSDGWWITAFHPESPDIFQFISHPPRQEMSSLIMHLLKSLVNEISSLACFSCTYKCYVLPLARSNSFLFSKTVSATLTVDNWKFKIEKILIWVHTFTIKAQNE